MESAPKKAKAGEHFVLKYYDDPFRSKVAPAEKYTIAKSCGQNSDVGRWACITHNVQFGNQMNKDGHIHSDPSSHTLAWWCPKCVQYETP